MLGLVIASLVITTIAAPTPDVVPHFDMDRHPTMLSNFSGHIHKDGNMKIHPPHHNDDGSHSFPTYCSDVPSTSTPNPSPSPLPTSPHNTTAVSPTSSSTKSSSGHSTKNRTVTPTQPTKKSSTSASTTSTTSAPNTASPTPSLSASAAAYLTPQNALRAKHSAKPFTWSATLASAAQTWANKCKWAHSEGAVGSYGENLAAGTGNFDAAAAVKAWADEASQYNFSNPSPSHFTQIVWKSSTQVGCASASCPGLLNSDVAQLHVCEYNPPGNVLGEFANNVS